MNFERYIAKKLNSSAGRFSKPIVIIGVVGVILSVSIILLSFAIVRGFTDGITEKAVGFNAHIQISDLNSIRGQEAGAILTDQNFHPQLLEMEGIKHVQTYVNKQAILETEEGISGVFVKGTANDFYWSFFEDKLVEGELLHSNDSIQKNEVLISKTIADRLRINLDDKITFYFIRNDDDFYPRKMKVIGIYNTDMIEFDEKFVLMDLRHLQKINNWGLEIQALVEDNCDNNNVKIELFSYGGDGEYHIEWSDGKEENSSERYFCPSDVNNLWAVLSDEDNTVTDTVFINISTVTSEDCDCNQFSSIVTTSGGSRTKYINGYEVYLDDFDELEIIEKKIRTLIGNELTTTSILKQSPEIFSWLELIDLNVYIIIILLFGVAIINMSSALIINILERTKLIGVLKSLGASNWSIRKIFLIHAAKLIGVGLLFGNILGLGLAWLQKTYSIIKLDPESYSLSEVPIIISWSDVVLLDIGTVIICLLALIIPSYLITKISPVKAIEID